VDCRQKLVPPGRVWHEVRSNGGEFSEKRASTSRSVRRYYPGPARIRHAFSLRQPFPGVSKPVILPRGSPSEPPIIHQRQQDASNQSDLGFGVLLNQESRVAGIVGQVWQGFQPGEVEGSTETTETQNRRPRRTRRPLKLASRWVAFQALTLGNHESEDAEIPLIGRGQETLFGCEFLGTPRHLPSITIQKKRIFWPNPLCARISPFPTGTSTNKGWVRKSREPRKRSNGASSGIYVLKSMAPMRPFAALSTRMIGQGEQQSGWKEKKKTRGKAFSKGQGGPRFFLGPPQTWWVAHTKLRRVKSVWAIRVAKCKKEYREKKE